MFYVLDAVFYNNTLQAWLIALTVAAAAFIALRLVQRVVVGRLHAMAQRTNTEIDDLIADVIARTRFWFFAVISLWAGAQTVALPGRWAQLLHSLLILALLLQTAIWGNGLITFWLERYRRRTLQQDATMATTIAVIGFVSRLLFWVAIVLMALENLGFPIGTLLAGLGVGGIAVALAVQNVLGDLFASLSIVLDKPFLIGDFITIDSFAGTVEHVGLKTTRLRSLTGEQLIFANSDLLKSRIRNYKRMNERRVVFTLGVAYETPVARLEGIPGMIREVVEAQTNVRFDRAHFKEYGAYSLNFEVVYWMLLPDYNLFMDTNQAVNLAIFRRFAAAGIQFAYPTQTILLPNTGGATE